MARPRPRPPTRALPTRPRLTRPVLGPNAAAPTAPPAAEPEATTKRPGARRRAALLKQARAHWKLWEEADKEQRQRELDDLRFFAGDQWDPTVKAARTAQQAAGGLPPLPARPTLTINKLREPVRHVLNQERQLDLGISIVPAEDFGATPSTDQTTAEIDLREGIVRRIQRESDAQDARTWAFARAVQSGRGYYGILVRYVKGKTFDREVYLRRFYNQNSVGLDPSHEQPDGSDAAWGFVGSDLSYEQYETEYPDVDGRPNDLLDLDDDEWRALGDEAPDWFRIEGERNLRFVRVVEYWYTVFERVTYALLPNDEIVELSQVPEGVKPKAQKTDLERRVKFAKLDGRHILDETDWETENIPIIKVLGEELQPYDKERRSEGMVRPARDPAQGFNAMVSKWVEQVALAPIPPFQVAEGQVEGYEGWYQAATTRTLPYLPYKTQDLEGRPVGPPGRTPAGTEIGAIAGSVQMFSEAIQSTVGVHDPSVGKTNPSLKSGRAIAAIVSQDEHGTSNYLDNLVRSMHFEAKVINELLYPVYGKREGRLMRLLNGQGEPKSVRLGMQPPGPNVKLTPNVMWNVAIKVTKSFQTRREQEASIVGELISANPQLMTVFGDLFFQNMDGPGHQQMAERAKIMLDPRIQQAMAQEAQGGEPLPPAATAQIQQLQAQLQQLGQAAQAMQQQIQTDQAKQQATIEKAKIDADKDLELARMRNATAIAVAEIQAATKGLVSAREAENERLALGLQHSHEVATAAATAATAPPPAGPVDTGAAAAPE